MFTFIFLGLIAGREDDAEKRYIFWHSRRPQQILKISASHLFILFNAAFKDLSAPLCPWSKSTDNLLS